MIDFEFERDAVIDARTGSDLRKETKGMIKLPDGSVWVDPGEKFPFQCPECKEIIRWHPLPVVKCDSCGYMGTPPEFSKVTYVMVDPTVN